MAQTCIGCFKVFFFVMSLQSFTIASRRDRTTVVCQTTGVAADCRAKHLIDIPTTIPHTTQKLYMDENPVKILKSNVFSLIPGLTELSMTNCHLGTLDVNSFVGLKNLTNLNLSNNSIKSFSDSLFGPDLKNLTFLNLSNNLLTRITQNALNHLVNLQELHLERNKLISIHPHAFTKLSHVTWISINHNSIVTAYASWFTPVAKTLKHLSLGHNPWVCDAKMCGYKNWTSSARKKISGAGDITCSKMNTSLKNVHSKTLCTTHQVTVIATRAPKMPVKTVGLDSTISLECPDKLSTSWKYMSKSKNVSFVPIKQDEKIKIMAGQITITGVAKHDSGTYCCLNRVGDDLQHTPAGEPHSTPHCFHLKIKSKSFTEPKATSSSSGGATAAVIIIIVVVLLFAGGVWYFRRKRRNYGLLSDETVFQPSYDDPENYESSHIPVQNGGGTMGDPTTMGEAYV